MPGTRIRIGQIVGVFGLEGWVKVEPLSDFPERFARGARVYLAGEEEPRQIQGVHEHKGQLRLKLRGVDSLEEAESHRAKYVEVPADQRPKLESDQYYTADLIGLDVIDAKAGLLGKVDSIIASPAQDLLQVGEILIPVAKQFVKAIDLEQKSITVELIPGMCPGDSADEA